MMKKITGKQLFNLKQSQYNKIGINLVDDQKKLKFSIEHLKVQPPTRLIQQIEMKRNAVERPDSKWVKTPKSPKKDSDQERIIRKQTYLHNILDGYDLESLNLTQDEWRAVSEQREQSTQYHASLHKYVYHGVTQKQAKPKYAALRN